MIDIDALFLVSVALGIAVDDTIHFLVRYRHERQAGKDLDEAVCLSLCDWPWHRPDKYHPRVWLWYLADQSLSYL